MEITLHNQRQALISEVEKRLQFITTCAIFFLALTVSFDKANGNADSDANHKLLAWAPTVAFYILNYVLFQIAKAEIGEKPLKLINRILLVGLASFFFPILILATDRGSSLPVAKFLFLFLSLVLLLLIPIVLCFIISFCLGCQAHATKKPSWFWKMIGDKTN